MMNDMKPIISTGKRIAPIWIVPILAIILGIWMVAYTFMMEGPEVKISFETAADLEAGKTKVKRLNVNIGVVEEITLAPNGSGVIVIVKLEKEHKDLLREDTRFWVERARIGTGGISGLGTILSGGYIKLAPGKGEVKKGEINYVGLEAPPLTPVDAPGIRLVLKSDHAVSVSSGEPVLYKGYQVGRVENRIFDESDKTFRYDVFIDAPFHDLVTTSVRFWNVSGIALSVSAEGFNLSMGSIETLLSGGISFGEPPDLPPGLPVSDKEIFRLYDTYQETLKHPYEHGVYYVVKFSEAIGALLPGAPVEYRGIKIGRVERILIKEMMSQGTKNGGQPIPVLIYLEPGLLALEDTPEMVKRLRDQIESGIDQGLRATLETGNLLTGSLFVSLDFYPDSDSAELGQFDQYPVIPAISGSLKRIQHSVSQLLDKINGLPIEEIASNANNAISQLDKSLLSLDKFLASEETQAIPEQLNGTLAMLRNTLDGLSPDSPIYEELESTLNELTVTLRSFDALSRTLSSSADLLPKSDINDPIPESK